MAGLRGHCVPIPRSEPLQKERPPSRRASSPPPVRGSTLQTRSATPRTPSTHAHPHPASHVKASFVSFYAETQTQPEVESRARERKGGNKTNHGTQPRGRLGMAGAALTLHREAGTGIRAAASRQSQSQRPGADTSTRGQRQESGTPEGWPWNQGEDEGPAPGSPRVRERWRESEKRPALGDSSGRRDGNLGNTESGGDVRKGSIYSAWEVQDLSLNELMRKWKTSLYICSSKCRTSSVYNSKKLEATKLSING
ncbi:uncharacterized protein LOC126066670 [Elephas maximus indicus]|uniref:uncharacterized protein LOC126066670 n=1 Tax=Elephas maximus indicus TaxID=99487 RepID=UPI002116FA92|nr:uncharacterized protein LOC126066670 [Elephas maximus indicus]